MRSHAAIVSAHNAFEIGKAALVDSNGMLKPAGYVGKKKTSGDAPAAGARSGAPLYYVWDAPPPPPPSPCEEASAAPSKEPRPSRRGNALPPQLAKDTVAELLYDGLPPPPSLSVVGGGTRAPYARGGTWDSPNPRAPMSLITEVEQQEAFDEDDESNNSIPPTTVQDDDWATQTQEEELPPPPVVVVAKQPVARGRRKPMRQKKRQEEPPSPHRFVVINQDNTGIADATRAPRSSSSQYHRPAVEKSRLYHTRREKAPAVTRHFARGSPILHNARYPTAKDKYSTEYAKEFEWPTSPIRLR